VTVIDRRDGVAAKTSFRNAGHDRARPFLFPGQPDGPPMLALLMKSLFGRIGAAASASTGRPRRMWAWSLRFLANCTTARNRAQYALGK